MVPMVNAVVLGIVEGVTEFLPVSSTGHLLIAESLLKCRQSDAFNVLIQVGPIVAVTLVFWRHILDLFMHLKDPEKRDEVIKLAASFILTAIGAFIAKKLGFKLPESVLPIALATLIGGIVIFVIEGYVRKKTLGDTVTWPIAIAVAVAQLLAAIFPGTSRSGAAVMAALLLGLSRPAAVRFAFLVGIPTMFAAGGYSCLESLHSRFAAGSYHLTTQISMGFQLLLAKPNVIVALVVATITAWLAVVWLLKFVQSNTFIPFAWYRVALGIGMFALMAFKIVA